MNKKKVLILLLALFSLGGFAAYYIERNGQSQELRLYGNVDIRDVELGFRVSGRIAEMRFEEGDRVKQGDLLATLDEKPYREAFDLARARRASAKAEMQKLLRGSRPQDIETARARVAESEAAFQNAQLIFRRRKSLAEKGVISQQDFDNTVASRDEAHARLKSAKEQLYLAVEGFRTEDVARAKAEYEAAVAQLEQARTALKDTQLYAPSPGQILTRVREPGAVVAVGATVYTLALDEPVWVRTYVSEPNLGRVYPGQEALVFTDTKPKEPYRGQVGFVSSQAEFTPKNVETTRLRTDLVYRLRVVIRKPDRGLRQGMPVTVVLVESKGHAGTGG